MEKKNMKKAYVKPTMENETFVPNKYVAACAGGATYDAWCNYTGYIFHDNNGNGRIDRGDTYIYHNTACSEHYRSEEEPKFNALAFHDYQVEWKGGLIFGTYVVKDRYKDDGVPGFVYKRDHFSTKFSTDPHYVS